MGDSKDPQEKEFLSDQPGWRMALLGLFISLTLGFLFRNAFSAEKVTYLVEKAASQIHRDVKIKLKSAHLSLSQGFLPSLRVVVKEVKAVSQKKCWLSPTLEVETIVLPISFFQLFQGKLEVQEIFLQGANLTLSSQHESCLEETTSSSSQGFSELKESEEGQNNLKMIHVDKLTAYYLPKAFTSFVLENLSYIVKDKKLIGKIHLSGETLFGDYSTQAQFLLRQEGSFLDGELNGNWREGRYQMRANYNLAEAQGEVSWQAQHLPIHQLIPIMSKYQMIHNDIDPQFKSSWVSGQGVLKTQNQEFNLLIQELKVDGDFGELSVENMSLKKGQQLEGSVRVKNLKLDYLVQDSNPVFANKGTFSGNIFWKNDGIDFVEGRIEGTEFIFSNKGERELQKISYLHCLAKQNSSGWKVELKDIRPDGGIFIGRIDLQANHKWDDLKFYIKLEEFALSAPVQALLTNLGQMGHWSGALTLQQKKGQWVGSHAFLRGRKLNIEGMEILQADIRLKNLMSNDFNIDFVFHDLKINAESASIPILRPLLDETQETLPLNFNRVNGIFSYKKDFFEWKQVRAKLGSRALSTQGGWDSQSKVFGSINYLNKSWSLEGTRDFPQLVRK